MSRRGPQGTLGPARESRKSPQFQERLRLWRRKGEYDTFPRMAIRSCRVTIQDMEGASHTVEVTAATLYEAVAQALASLRGHDWVAEIAQGLNVARVSVADVRIEHEVRLGDFSKWLNRTNGSPREINDRQKIRVILGIQAPR
jgi:hypothetical protein